MAGVTAKRRVLRVDEGAREVRFDTVADEEPLEMRVDGAALTVTMRTPGNDFELAAGFLLTEGVVENAGQIRTLRYCVAEDESQEFNVLNADLAPGAPGRAGAERTFMATSSCGLCGKASIDGVRARSPFDVRADGTEVAASVLAALPDRLRGAQRVFDRTGGLHAAGLFTADGELVCAHVAYRNDISCTNDCARGSGTSIFDEANRSWLEANYGVTFRTVDELLAEIRK